MSGETVEVRRGDVVVLSWAGPADTEDMARASLGVDDQSEVEVFPASKISPVGLVSYLIDGHGIAATDLGAQAATLEGLQGTVVVVTSRAFADGSGRLEVREPMRLVGQFREAAAEIGAPLPIETESAKGNLGGKADRPPKSDARVGGMVAMVVLLFLAVFVVFFVWSAG